MADLQERMTYAEFVHWIAKYKRHPFGEMQQDYRFGVLASLLNGVIQSWAKRRLNLPRMEKYFPALAEMMQAGAARQSPEEMANILRTLTKQMGGTITRADGTVEDYSHGKKKKPVTRPQRVKPTETKTLDV